MSAEPVYNVPIQGTTAELGPSRKVLVQDADRFRKFEGYLLHRVSTEVAHKPQWLEIEAWKVTDGTCRYVLHFTGKSVLVHKENSDCNTGVPTPASKLPDDSEACRKCRPDLRSPAERKKDSTIFEAETDRHKVEICDGRPKDENGKLLTGDDGKPLPITDENMAWQQSAREMIRTLRESWHRKPEAAGTLSAPAQRLVDTVAMVDDAVRSATRVVESI